MLISSDFFSSWSKEGRRRRIDFGAIFRLRSENERTINPRFLSPDELVTKTAAAQFRKRRRGGKKERKKERGKEREKEGKRRKISLGKRMSAP